MFVQDLMTQLDAFAEVEAVAPGSMNANTLMRISEEQNLDMPSKEAADVVRESIDPERNAELLAKRKRELVGKTIAGKLKPSFMGSRKGYFIKWNEHDNDTIYVSKARAEQHLGPNPRTGMWVKCTIVDLGPAWAPWDRQHPFTQAIIAADDSAPRSLPNSRPASQRGVRRAKPVLDLSPVPVQRPRAGSKSVDTTPSPRSAQAAAASWELIQNALAKGKILTPEATARESWGMVKEAILNQKIVPALNKCILPNLNQDKSKMPRNRRSSAFACRQHRRSDFGGAATNWRRGSALSSASNSPKSLSNSSRGIRPTRSRPMPQRSQSSRGIRRQGNQDSRFGSLRRQNSTPLAPKNGL